MPVQVSFEKSKLRGRNGTLIIILMPVVNIAIFALVLLQVIPDFGMYLPIALGIPVYAGHVLFLSAMKGFGKYYYDSGIFKNSLYGFITNVVSVISYMTLIYGFMVPEMDRISASIIIGTPPDLSTIVYIFQILLFLFLAVFVTMLVQALFYRRSFRGLAEKSGEGNFSTAGTLMLIGGVLAIILVGVLVFFIGWIFTLKGFYSMKAKTNHAVEKELL